MSLSRHETASFIKKQPEFCPLDHIFWVKIRPADAKK